MKRVLFICSRNRLRSPTAEKIFARWPGIETSSAGLAHDADDRLTPDHLEDVDMIFVMEKAHKTKLNRQFKTHLKHARIICLDIPDDYTYMQPELVSLLEKKITPYLKN